MRFQARTLGVYDSDKHKLTDAYSAFDRYMAWLGESHADDGLSVVDVERRLYLSLGEFHGDNVVLTVEPDLIVRDKYGLLHIIDWKFVERFTSLASFIGSNRQGLTYSMVTEAEYGQPVTSFTLNQINRKPPKTKSFLPVERVTNWNAPTAVAQHRAYLLRIVSDMVKLHQEVEAGDETGAYPNPDFMCQKACPYWSICCEGIAKSQGEIAEEVRVNFRRKEETL